MPSLRITKDKERSCEFLTFWNVTLTLKDGQQVTVLSFHPTATIREIASETLYDLCDYAESPDEFLFELTALDLENLMSLFADDSHATRQRLAECLRCVADYCIERITIMNWAQANKENLAKMADYARAINWGKYEIRENEEIVLD